MKEIEVDFRMWVNILCVPDEKILVVHQPHYPGISISAGHPTSAAFLMTYKQALQMADEIYTILDDVEDLRDLKDQVEAVDA